MSLLGLALFAVTFSLLGLVTGVAGLLVTWMTRHRVNAPCLVSVVLCSVILPLNLYHLLRLWP